MGEIKDLTAALLKFRDERDWQQFHNSKDLALAISIEASELLELFLWKGNEEVDPEKLKDELADVMSYCLLLAEKHGINIPDIVSTKIEKNSHKYPVSKSKGSSKKYNDLG
jgi:NTP pyrophosphatase (non-canonical NTP hydrolase)